MIRTKKKLLVYLIIAIMSVTTCFETVPVKAATIDNLISGYIRCYAGYMTVHFSLCDAGIVKIKVYKNVNGGSYTYFKTVNDTTYHTNYKFNDTNISDGKRYGYKIVGYNERGEVISSGTYYKLYFAPVQNLKASVQTINGKKTLVITFTDNSKAKYTFIEGVDLTAGRDCLTVYPTGNRYTETHSSLLLKGHTYEYTAVATDVDADGHYVYSAAKKCTITIR